MPKFEKKQEVKLFADEKNIGTQEVYLDTEDPCEVWMTVTHDGNEISLSARNWKKLTGMVDIVFLEAGV